MVFLTQLEFHLRRPGVAGSVSFQSQAGICRKEKGRRAVVKAGMWKCEETASFRPLKGRGRSSDWSEGMAFAQRLILLGVERLPLQVDLAELQR